MNSPEGKRGQVKVRFLTDSGSTSNQIESRIRQGCSASLPVVSEYSPSPVKSMRSKTSKKDVGTLITFPWCLGLEIHSITTPIQSRGNAQLLSFSLKVFQGQNASQSNGSQPSYFIEQNLSP